MISGLLTLLLIATATGPEANGFDALIADLAPEGERAELYFREQRESALLEEPLVVTGKLWRNERGDLVRETAEPRRETQTLTGEMIIIEKPGRTPRNHSLSHAPELEVLYRALSALLAGDAQALRRHFDVVLEREASGWIIRLTPDSPELAERVDALTLRGTGDELQRFELALADGETIVTELSATP
jgi:hypothetical protein